MLKELLPQLGAIGKIVTLLTERLGSKAIVAALGIIGLVILVFQDKVTGDTGAIAIGAVVVVYMICDVFYKRTIIKNGGVDAVTTDSPADPDSK